MLKRLFLFALLLPTFVFATEAFVAGKDYEILTNPAPINAQEKVNVTEFFSYGCPWCYRIDSAVMQWVTKHQNAIHFTRIPVIFNKEWTYYAKAYYAAQLLDLEARMNPLLFKAIQTDKQALNTNTAMIDFFVKEGVDKATATSAFTHSTTIDMHIKEGNALMGQFRINGVPAFVVNQTFKTDLQMAKSEERLIKILDFLLGQSKSDNSIKK